MIHEALKQSIETEVEEADAREAESGRGAVAIQQPAVPDEFVAPEVATEEEVEGARRVYIRRRKQWE